jgi:hypothetical protein
MTFAKANCLSALMQLACCALRLAAAKAGNNMAAKIAMMAITTSSSINVNADRRELVLFFIFIHLLFFHKQPPANLKTSGCSFNLFFQHTMPHLTAA